MRIGFLLPANIGLGNPFSGVARLARLSEQAVQEHLGYETVKMTPWEHVRHANLDMIHAFTTSPSFERGRAASGVPWALTPVHDSLKPAWKYRIAVQCGRLPRIVTEASQKRSLLHCVDRTLAMSTDERIRLISHFGLNPGSVIVVPCPAPEVEPLRPEEVARVLSGLRLAPGEYVAAVCDYGSTRKNILRLIAAAQHSKMLLVLAGNASSTAVREAIVATSATDDRIRVLGAVDNKVKMALMQGAAAYCQPSLEEGAGLAAMEAALLGTPVVASDVGGVREHLGPSAVWVEPTDVLSIAQGLASALGSDATAVSEFIRRHHSLEAYAHRLDSAYASVLQN